MNFKYYIARINLIFIIGGLIFYGCEDNIQKWELTIDISPNESGLVVHHISNVQIDTLENSQYYVDGTELNVEAFPQMGWEFDRWKGDLEYSENPTIILKDGHKSVSAVFKKMQYSVSILKSGQGEVVVKSLNGIGSNYDYGSDVEITAIPDAGWTFDHWEGDLDGSMNPAKIIIDNSKSITAVFKSNVYGNDSTFTFIALGQSNMIGVGDDGGDLGTDSRVKTWNDVANEWILADPSKSLESEIMFNNYHTNHNNLAFHFAKRIAEVYNVEVRMLIIAKSGINIGQFIINVDELTLYDSLRNNISISDINEIDCILWHQGESNNFGEASTYADSLQSIINKLRSEPEIDVNTPFIAGELIDGTPRDTRNDVYFNIDWFINDKYVGVAKLHDLAGIDDDKVHFNGSSLITAGRERYFEAFRSMVE